MSYCQIALGHPVHGPFHDHEHGFPIRGDDALFERLILEINQAGLSWLAVLKKRENFRAAFDGFAIDKVAKYGDKKKLRLLSDAGIIRNRLKIDAAIENARRIVAIRDQHGSFASWLDSHHPLAKDEWIKLFRKTLVFTGGEITNEFLIGVGYLPGAHDDACPIFARVAREKPPWMKSAAKRPSASAAKLREKS
ncbi:MAG TPA: DNA-3-methyladenine glycosylase I [Candidatus Binataceae bacterium]|nr:DNA-3-methyladenine glycosylase I [Candidatus Binataceae bacterium]